MVCKINCTSDCVVSFKAESYISCCSNPMIDKKIFSSDEAWLNLKTSTFFHSRNSTFINLFHETKKIFIHIYSGQQN